MNITENKPLEQPTLSKMDVFLVLLLICISGNPFFGAMTKFKYIIVAIFVTMISIMYEKPLLSKRTLLWVIVCSVLLFLQYCILNRVSINADVNFFARLYLGSSIMIILGERFRYAYLKIMAFLAGVSLVLWLVNSFVMLPGIEVPRHRSLIFFNYINKANFDGFRIRRNCGMFWEPGAYQGFIMIVPLLYIGQIRNLLSQYKKECVILFAALLSTMSTTGYVVLAVLAMLLIMKNINNVFLKFFVAFVAVAVFIWAYNTFDFLGEKIESQYEEAMALESGKASLSRMGALQIDIENIKQHPFVGNGFLMSEKYGDLADEMRGAGNGFSGAINIFGLPLILLYLFGLYRNAPAATKFESMIFPLIIMLLLNGEYFLNYPLFWSLLFVKYPELYFEYEEYSYSNDGF